MLTFAEYTKHQRTMAKTKKKPEEMRILTLIIKQKYFDEIIAGTKKQEFREIRPTTWKKYVQHTIEPDGSTIMEVQESGHIIPIEYDAIRFYVGYNKDRDTALVEVTSIGSNLIVDEDNEIITYEDKYGNVFNMEEMVYDLGEVLECQRKGKTA